MNGIARLGCVLALSTVGFAPPALATTTYDFSYTMSNGAHLIAGSFDAGGNNGVFVDTSAIGNISVSFDGTPLNGPMVGNYYDVVSSAADPVVSFIYNQNAFIFSNCSQRNCAGGVPPDYNYLVVRHSNLNQNVDVYFHGVEYADGQPNTSWSLAARPPVPEPGSYAMMALGLAALAFAARRRQAG